MNGDERKPDKECQQPTARLLSSKKMPDHYDTGIFLIKLKVL